MFCTVMLRCESRAGLGDGEARQHKERGGGGGVLQELAAGERGGHGGKQGQERGTQEQGAGGREQ